jgi:hypothetical protein
LVAPPHVQLPPTQPSATFPQLAHAAPFVPQADAVGLAMQVVPEQQPLGHELASHTHWPLVQCCPDEHERPLPH